MIHRLQRPVDFERVLGRPTRARSAHFALHHLAASPAPSAWHQAHASSASSTAPSELSTVSTSTVDKLVDDSAPAACWIGMVVPKRHAKRAVTRTLLKRQIRSAFAAHVPLGLPAGLWVVRLRAPFDKQRFPSAASDALRAAARKELGDLLARALPRAVPRAADAGAAP